MQKDEPTYKKLADKKTELRNFTAIIHYKRQRRHGNVRNAGVSIILQIIFP
jgi:hypothetical protein